MDISSLSNASFSRSVTPAKNSSDRQSGEQSQASLTESKVQDRREHERAVQEKLQHSREENQRRLEGRIISFGHEQLDDASNQQNQVSYNRSRVNEAYSAAGKENSGSYLENIQRPQEREMEAIDIIV